MLVELCSSLFLSILLRKLYNHFFLQNLYDWYQKGSSQDLSSVPICGHGDIRNEISLHPYIMGTHKICHKNIGGGSQTLWNLSANTVWLIVYHKGNSQDPYSVPICGHGDIRQEHSLLPYIMYTHKICHKQMEGGSQTLWPFFLQVLYDWYQKGSYQDPSSVPICGHGDIRHEISLHPYIMGAHKICHKNIGEGSQTVWHFFLQILYDWYHKGNSQDP